MKARFASSHPPRRKSLLLTRFNHRFNARRQKRRVQEIQMIYAHFGPPVVFSVAEPFRYVPGLAHGTVVTGLPQTDGRSALFK